MKVLFVNACLRQESRTKKLADAYLKKLKEFDNSVEIKEIVLQNLPLKPLNSEILAKRDMLSANNDFDNSFFDYANEFAAADKIVVAAPYYDLQFPAVLKTYLENICVCGIAFKYNENGIPQGLCKANQLVYVTTAGGYLGNLDFGFDYIKGLCMLLGIAETKKTAAEGLDIYGNNVDEILNEAIDKIVIDN